MACRFPLLAVRAVGSDQRPSVVSRSKYRNGKKPLSKGFEYVELCCGQCRSCRLEKSRVWGFRIEYEAAYIEEEYGLHSTFITLTYSEKDLPYGGTLVPYHLEKFFKRFRSRIAPRKIRYYAAGEYGSKCPQHEINDCPVCGPVQRPHYHAIILGFDFPDREYVGDRDGNPVYFSEFLESLWPYGFHEIGSASFESACYTARYIMKKVNGKGAQEHYTRYDPWTNTWFEVIPEFARMSTKPGIGRDWFEKYKDGIYPSDECAVLSRGMTCMPPAYYDRIFGEGDPIGMEMIKAKRREKAEEAKEKGPSGESKAKVEDARLRMLARKL